MSEPDPEFTLAPGSVKPILSDRCNPVAGDSSHVAASDGVILGGTQSEFRFGNPAQMIDPPDNALAASAGQLLSLLSNATHLDVFLDRMVRFP